MYIISAALSEICLAHDCLVFRVIHTHIPCTYLEWRIDLQPTMEETSITSRSFGFARGSTKVKHHFIRKNRLKRALGGPLQCRSTSVDQVSLFHLMNDMALLA